MYERSNIVISAGPVANAPLQPVVGLTIPYSETERINYAGWSIYTTVKNICLRRHLLFSSPTIKKYRFLNCKYSVIWEDLKVVTANLATSNEDILWDITAQERYFSQYHSCIYHLCQSSYSQYTASCLSMFLIHVPHVPLRTKLSSLLVSTSDLSFFFFLPARYRPFLDLAATRHQESKLGLGLSWIESSHVFPSNGLHTRLFPGFQAYSLISCL